MIVGRYDPINLFEMVPTLDLRFEPGLAHLDGPLDDDKLFDPVKADLLNSSLDITHRSSKDYR